MFRAGATLTGAGAAALALGIMWVPSATQAHGGWAPEGVRVASSYADRAFPVAAPDGEGGVFVAWQEFARIRLQRLTAEGIPAPGWSASHGREVCAPSGYGGYEQSSPRAIPDGAGGVYVLWHDERETGCRSSCLGEPKQIYVQRFGPDGSVAEGWPALGRSVGSWLSRMSPTPGGTRGYPGEMNTVLAPDGRGGLLVAWVEQSLRGNAEPGLRVQRVGPRGDLLWGERGVRVTSPPAAARFPSVVAERAGGALVVWQDERDPRGPRLFAQRVSAAGEPLLARNGVPATSGALSNERFPRMLAQAPDGALLVWEADAGPGARGLWAKRVRYPERGPDHPEVPLTASALPEGEIALHADRSGGAWAAWVDVRGETSRDLYAHRLLPNGRPHPVWPEGGAPVVTTPSADRSRPMLAGDGAAGVFVGWRDAREPRLAAITGLGRPARGWPEGGLPLTTEPGVDRGLDLVSDGRTAAIGVWDQWLGGMGLDDVRAQRVARDRPLARPPDRLPIGPNSQFERGLTATLAIEGPRPNPGRGALDLAILLPGPGPATLEVFDVAGRRVAAREFGVLGAGRHRARIGAGERLAPGMYVIRLTHGGRSVATRGVISP